MVTFPNAKINLGLHVKFKRDDGFHELETVMMPIPLYDVLEILPGKKIELHVSGIGLSETSIEDNLVYKAWQMLNEHYRVPPVRMFLHKKIPTGAGLGGGSADAVFALKAMNKIFDLQVPLVEMENHAAKLGSDCALFIQNQAALATGRGEKLHPFAIDLNGKYLFLVVPDLHVSTADAYRGVETKIPERSLHQIIHEPLSSWEGKLKNDFESSIFRRFPKLEQIKRSMYEAGAIYASMSGSGSAIFGLFEKAPKNLDFPKSYFSTVLIL